jgi:hypothetical protein
LNQEKTEVGENIRLIPYDLLKNVDKTGKKNELDANPLFNHYKPLH